MAGDKEPKTMRAWLYSTAAGGLEKNLKLSEATVKPVPKDQVLVKVRSTSLNPADYKLPELGMVARLAISMPAAPCMDFAGTVEEVGDAVKSADTFRVGERVYGRVAAQQYGALSEVVSAKPESLAKLPEGVSEEHASCIGTAGLTAYQSIAPHVKAGDKVFINGGSGGVGTFGIQIAKALGCHVTTTCSGKNADFVRSLGADEVIDYTKENVCDVMKAKGPIFKLAVDNVGHPAGLYKAGDDYLVPQGKFIQIGGDMSLGAISSLATTALRPSFLGGGKHSWQFMVLAQKQDDLVQVGKLMQEGKVKAIIDETFEFKDAPKAFEKLKTGRCRGNVVVEGSK